MPSFTLTKPRPTIKTGDALCIPVAKEAISDSDPCNKDNCFLTRAFIYWLVTNYGGTASDYKVKSTNHGVVFLFKGYQLVGVFDTKTASRIYKYDAEFKRTHSKEKARMTVKPFVARIMIESKAKHVKNVLSEEAKQKLRTYKPSPVYKPRRASKSRELSL